MKSRPHGPLRRPSIGVTPDRAIHDDGLAHYDLKVPYCDAVLRAGGLPLVLPYSDDPSAVEGYLDRISGLLVTGGAFDVPPQAYGEAAHEGLGPLKEGRTSFEAALLRGAIARSMPILGVCGGMQLLNVVMGGTLFQDIPREVPNARDHEQKHDRTQPHHPVDLKDGTQLSECLGRGQLMVNSTHHQAVKTPGKKLVVSALAPDGVVEAIEATDHPFAVGVQWHPELLMQAVPTHLSVYRAFVQKARETRR